MNEIELKARELLAQQLGPLDVGGVVSGAGDLFVAESAAIKAISAALAPQWQGIESAPKDGRPILLHSPAWQVKVVEGGWDAHELAWRVRGYGCPASQPTHFQPLPAPPEVEG